MSTFDVEQSPSVARAVPAHRREGPVGEAGTVMTLQRLAGNSAVAEAIRSGRLGAGPGTLDIQRLAGDTDTDEEESDELDVEALEAGDYDLATELSELPDSEEVNDMAEDIGPEEEEPEEEEDEGDEAE
jgi:hypothetical protein